MQVKDLQAKYPNDYSLFHPQTKSSTEEGTCDFDPQMEENNVMYHIPTVFCKLDDTSLLFIHQTQLHILRRHIIKL